MIFSTFRSLAAALLAIELAFSACTTRAPTADDTPEETERDTAPEPAETPASPGSEGGTAPASPTDRNPDSPGEAQPTGPETVSPPIDLPPPEPISRPSPRDAVWDRREISLAIGTDETGARTWDAIEPAPSRGIVFISGMPGEYTEPVDSIYERTADMLVSRGVSSIFVKYREPGDLSGSIKDTMAGVQHLRNQGITKMAIVGWSFGGAVMIHTATLVPEIATVVGFAPQSLDTEPVANFKHQSLLLFHSEMDDNVPYEQGSVVIMGEAPATIEKRLVTLTAADHYMDSAAPEIDPVFWEWLEKRLLN